MIKQHFTQNHILLLLFFLVLVRGLIYASLTIPWWQGHDEEHHFSQIRLLVDQWSPPTKQSRNWPQEMVATFYAFPHGRWSMEAEQPTDLVNISERFIETGRFSVSYYPYACLGMFLTRQELLSQLFLFRFVSILITCGTVVFAFLSAKHIFPNSLMTQILILWLILFTPAIMIATIIFYLLLLEFTRERISISWRSLLALVLTIMAFQTKATTFFLIFVWGILILIYAWKFGQKYCVLINT